MSFRATALCLCVCVFAAGAAAQSTAVLQGVVQDPSGAVIPEARIRVENPVTRFRAEMLTSKEGVFEIRNIPFHTYTVTIEREGFEPHEDTVSLRSNVPHEMLVRLAPAGVRDSITVAAVSQLLVDPEETGTHVQMNQSDIEKLALQAGNKGLESIIVSMPGFAQNANGAIHPRGAHNQMTFVIDGMPVSDQLTGAFANAVDPNIVQTVELFTGNVPAEYGNKVSAVANITTKSGVGTGRRFGGSTLLNAAQFDLLSQVTQAGLQQAIGKRASLKVSCYHKGSKNLQDSKNFLDTGIIFPTTLARIRVNGVEGRLAGTAARGLSLTLSVTHSRAIATPPFTGGLFLGNDAVESFSLGAFVIDHDQPLSVHAVLNWNHRRGWYATASNRYDYGLVANPSDPGEAAADPDFRDLLPYVKHGQTPARVRPRNIADLVVGFEKTRDQKKRCDIGLQLTNLTRRTALYNFQSIFVGTRVVQPFTAGVRLRYYF